MVAHGGAALQGAIVGGGVRQAAATIPSAAARRRLLHAYRVGFASPSNHLMIIGAVMAVIGSVGAFVLVRQRDFVPSYAPAPPAPPERRPGRPAAVPDGGAVTHGTPAVAGPDRRRPAPAAGPGGPATSGPARPSPTPPCASWTQLGYARVSMESVAREAGVARATVYRRYRDKADLITAAIAGNSPAHLADGPTDDPRADLVRYLDEFDERFAESCLEVMGTLLGRHGRTRGPWTCTADGWSAPGWPTSGRCSSGPGRAGPAPTGDADLDLALQMLVGRSSPAAWPAHRPPPGWAERAVDAVWAGMGTGA